MPMDEERDGIQTETDRQDKSQGRPCVCVDVELQLVNIASER